MQREVLIKREKVMAPLNRSSSSSKLPVLQHFTHPKHPLLLLNHHREFLCNGCNELGFGLRYHCATCDFDLHDVCATCPVTAASPLHPHHPLTLVNHPVNDRSCDLCGDLVHGLFYTCRACDFDVHPLCTQLPPHVQIPLHPQHLLKLQPAGPAGCASCFKACTAWRYRCDVCFLDIHVECAFGGGPDVISHATAAAPVTMSKAIVPQPQQQQVGFGGYYGMPTPGQGMVMNLQDQEGPSKVEGKKTSGKKRKKVYAIVGRLAATAALTAIIGVPIGI